MTPRGNEPDDADAADRAGHEGHLRDAIRLAMGNVRERRTWPFGAVVVRHGRVLARAVNEVEALCDPSAHAEMQAVRAAARVLGDTDLTGCVVYASGFPCAMCLAAMHLAGVASVYYAYDEETGAAHGLSAARGYDELARPPERRETRLVGLPVRDAADEDLYEAWRRVAGG